MFFSTSEIIFLVASSIGILALFSKDMLILQALYLVASILFLISGLIFKIPVIIFVNICYILVNSYQIIRLLLERSTVIVPFDLKDLYQQVFFELRPREFLKLINLADRLQAKPGEYLLKNGDTSNNLLLILSGEVAIKKGNDLVCNLKQFFFLGEMRYLTHKPISADVISLKETIYFKWTYDKLLLLQNKNPRLKTKLIEIIGKDLIDKLQSQKKFT